MLIAFDLDDTLIDTSGAVTPYKIQLLSQFFELHGLRGEKLEQLNRTTGSLRLAICECLSGSETQNLCEEALSLCHQLLPESFSVPTTPSASKVLNILKMRGHIITLVTGGKIDFQMDKFKKSGLEPSVFSKIRVAEDYQKMSHYMALMKEFSVLPDMCLAVGDRLQKDLEPARSLGWRTVHMRWGRGKCEKRWVDESISDLSGLLDIL